MTVITGVDPGLVNTGVCQVRDGRVVRVALFNLARGHNEDALPLVEHVTKRIAHLVATHPIFTEADEVRVEFQHEGLMNQVIMAGVLACVGARGVVVYMATVHAQFPDVFVRGAGRPAHKKASVSHGAQRLGAHERLLFGRYRTGDRNHIYDAFWFCVCDPATEKRRQYQESHKQRIEHQDQEIERLEHELAAVSQNGGSRESPIVL
jgi:hypothetical protein